MKYRVFFLVTIFMVSSLISMDHTNKGSTESDRICDFIIGSFGVDNKLNNMSLFKQLLLKNIGALQEKDARSYNEFKKFAKKQSPDKYKNNCENYHAIAGALCSKTYSEYLDDIHVRSNWNSVVLKLGISGLVMQACLITIYFVGVLPPLLVNC